MSNSDLKTGLILSGGGARAAYQVGVLKAIADVLPRNSKNPFPIICGTSAGSINAVTLAIYASQFRTGIRRLSSVWENFHVQHVFRADTLGIMSSGAHWLAAMVFRGLGRHNPVSLLDRAPLRRLLQTYLPCGKIQKAIDKGALHAISISASSYTTGKNVTFFQGIDGIEEWERVHRVGMQSRITLEHLMASSAIPFVFAPVRIHKEFFGDGSMRQNAPISPALHLGADRVLVIGVRQPMDRQRVSYSPEPPSLAQVSGHVLNSIFLDSLEADLERLERINNTIQLIPDHHLEEEQVVLRQVEVFNIAPSEDISELAAKYAYLMPRTVRMIFRGLGGTDRQGIDLISYLLFEKEFCRALIDLGYRDTMRVKTELLRFLD